MASPEDCCSCLTCFYFCNEVDLEAFTIYKRLLIFLGASDPRTQRAEFFLCHFLPTVTSPYSLILPRSIFILFHIHLHFFHFHFFPLPFSILCTSRLSISSSISTMVVLDCTGILCINAYIKLEEVKGRSRISFVTSELCTGFHSLTLVSC